MALAEEAIAPWWMGERRIGGEVPLAVVRIEQARTGLVRPLFIFSTAFYVIGLLTLAYFPDVVAYKVVGSINVAYLLALAQFVMTFAVAYIYARQANRLVDPLVAEAFAELAKTRTSGVSP